MRAIIIAAGEATRWNNHLGIPKHFAPIDGEPILERTVRQITSYGGVEAYVVGPDERYKFKGAELFIPVKNPANADLDKFLNSSELWLEDGRTVIFYGDVYFTDEAMDRIITSTRDGFVLHARPFNSYLTGTNWGECFALSFYGVDIPMLREAMARCIKLFEAGTIPRTGGWEVYRSIIRIPVYMMKDHYVSDVCFNDINDWTDDFDFPEDYDRFLRRRKEAGA